MTLAPVPYRCISNEFFREAHKGETGKTGIGSIGR